MGIKLIKSYFNNIYTLLKINLYFMKLYPSMGSLGPSGSWLVMGLGQKNFAKFLPRLESGLGLENFPLKIPNFFPFGSKKSYRVGQKVTGSKGGRPFIYCRSKVCLGRVRSGPISRLMASGWEPEGQSLNPSTSGEPLTPDCLKQQIIPTLACLQL